MAANPKHFLTEEAYLELERASDIKHEYFQGEALAMAGASFDHVVIVGNTTTVLNNQLKDKPCVVCPTDLKLKVEKLHFYSYPDIMLVCGKPHFTDDKPDTITNPLVIIEVLSTSTEQYDRGKKFQRYQLLESLQEYILIAQDSPYIERFLRQSSGEWLYTSAAGLEAVLELTSIQCSLALSDVYAKIEFTPPPEPQE